jgi:predicted AAA+ superfamily ATPase
MAVTNYERVGKALDIAKEALKPFIIAQFKGVLGGNWENRLLGYVNADAFVVKEGVPFKDWDVTALVALLLGAWEDVFRKTLGKAERNLVFELRNIRNDWGHQQPFSLDAAYRALDSIEQLLRAVSSPEAAEVGKSKMEILRIKFDDEAKKEIKRVVVKKAEGVAESPQAGARLKSWRDVISPHPDVASGRFQQAEFMADLWQVYQGQASSEYQDPKEFFRRTYLTEGLKNLLEGAVRRLSGDKGDPVIELQTNFGGGKTHSMLALWHLCSGAAVNELPGLEQFIAERKLTTPGKVNRVVLVGQKISPGQPSKKADGTVVNTLWGELAWQLGEQSGEGGAKAYSMVAEADRTGTNPGDTLRELFDRYAPVLILIDEWVAYARQLFTNQTLPAGSFDTQFTFAQTLSESARNADRCLLILSIPASDNEIGGDGGKASVDRLKNAIGRVQAPWQPATDEEGYEIVRRRLFQDDVDHVARDAVVKSFADIYRKQSTEFPGECKELSYERKLTRAYPIHPLLFEQLTNDWGALDRFQKTRGVLRLMSEVIHALWMRQDDSLMILPSSIPMDEPDVVSELTRYMDENWKPLIAKDVDGSGSLPEQLDKDNPSLGRYAAARKVARAIYLGSAPLQGATHRGLEERIIKLACAQPEESPAIYGDALRRLAEQATFLYMDNKRYWFDTQPTVRRMAEDRAFRIDAVEVEDEIIKRLQRAASGEKGLFERVHIGPRSPSDIADEAVCRLVILPPSFPHVARAEESPALAKSAELLDTKGTGGRLYRNTLVFLAADKTRLRDLEQSTRMYLAWKSIWDEREKLELGSYQAKQTENQLGSSEDRVVVQIPEAYHWALYPDQSDPRETQSWTEAKVTGTDPLVLRTSKKLEGDGVLFRTLGFANLKMELDRVPLWSPQYEGNAVTIRQLKEYFAQYVYLPRLSSSRLIDRAISDGVSNMNWEIEAFAYAEGWDEANKRYLGLKVGEVLNLDFPVNALVVRPQCARSQMDADSATRKEQPEGSKGAGGNEGKGASDVTSVPGSNGGPDSQGKPKTPEQPQVQRLPNRFYGKKTLKWMTMSSDAGKVQEALSRLFGLIGAEVEISLDIHVKAPKGIDADLQRVVRENCNVLKFEDYGMEEE